MRWALNPRASVGRRRTLRIIVTCGALVFFVVSTWAGTFTHAPGGWVQDKALPDGPGKEETRKVCSGCHELEKSFSVRQDRVGWQNTIEKMISIGAKATDVEFDAVLDYLVRHFPADDAQLINVNKASAIDLESGLSLKRSEAAAIIKYRTQVGRFKSIADLKKVPGIDPARIEAKKDRLLFEELR